MARILITGATAGIGRAAALHFASRGHHVLATGRKQELLDTLASEVGDPKRLETIRLDVVDQAQIDDAVRIVDEKTEGHGLDVLINNAGYGLLGPTSEVSDAALRQQFDTNVFGLMAVTRAFLPKMLARREGRIVNVSSVGGRVVVPFLGVYNASKFAVEALSDALRMELGPIGIKISLVEPGPINTAFTETAMSSVAATVNETSVFKNVLAESDKIRKKFDGVGAPVEVVVRALDEAATSASPRARYIVPGSFTPIVWMARNFPTAIVDACQRMIVGISAKKLTPPGA